MRPTQRKTKTMSKCDALHALKFDLSCAVTDLEAFMPDEDLDPIEVMSYFSRRFSTMMATAVLEDLGDRALLAPGLLAMIRGCERLASAATNPRTSRRRALLKDTVKEFRDALATLERLTA